MNCCPRSSFTNLSCLSLMMNNLGSPNSRMSFHRKKWTHNLRHKPEKHIAFAFKFSKTGKAFNQYIIKSHKYNLQQTQYFKVPIRDWLTQQVK